MNILLTAVLLVAQGSAAPPVAGGSAPEGCLHGANETRQEGERRREAVAVMRMIDWVMQRHAIGRLPDVWPVMGNLAATVSLKDADGRVGELARRIAWGTGEPLPLPCPGSRLPVRTG